MKRIYTFLSIYPVLLLLSFGANANDAVKDTVIIEVNKNTKIVIYTKSKDDLAALNNYDINQMIKDLNAQLSDSVTYLEINEPEGKAYVNGEEVEMTEDKEKINIQLGGVEVEIEPDEIEKEDWDADDWDEWESKWEKKEWNGDATYAKKSKRTTNDFNVDIGLNNWLDNGQFPDANNSPYSVKGFGSWYVALNSVNKTWIAGPLVLDWGLGISWYNWKLEDASNNIIKGDNAVEFIPSSVAGRKSKLTASYLNIHVVPMLDFSNGRQKVTNIKGKGIKINKYSKKGFRMGAGMYAGYRLGSHTKFIDENGDKDKESGNFFLENFRYGVRAQLGWKGIELWGAYDLNNVFFEGRGPAGSEGLNAISFGVTL